MKLTPIYATVRVIIGYRGKCPECKCDFITKRSDAKRCGNRCAARAYRARKKKRGVTI